MANEKTINARLQQKHDIKAHWELAANFIPKAGEIIVYDDLNKIKIGDGTTYVNKLPFTNGSVGEKHINENGEVKGEIFNDYANNTAAGLYSHAEGYKTSTGFKGYSEVYYASLYGDNPQLVIESIEPAKYYSIGDNLQIGLVDGSILKDRFKISSIYETNIWSDVPDATQIGLSKLTDEDITISWSDIKYIGVSNKPYGDIAIGGAYAHAEGHNTLAIGENAHAEGKDTVASGDYSHAGGLSTIASEKAQTAIGQYNAEDTDALFIVGNGTSYTDKKNAFTVNKDGTATLAMVGENDNNVATVGYVKANGSVGEKYINESGEVKGEIFNNYENNTADGLNSHAEGRNTTAGGNESHAEGSFTKAYGASSHAEGESTYADGLYSHAEGCYTHAYGVSSHAEGWKTYANAQYAHAGGYYTIADQESQTAIGKYNDNTTATSALFVVGNGTSDTDRKNAFTVNKDGSATLAKVGENDNNIATVGYLNAQLNALITVADIDTICGGNIVAASEVTF